VATYVAPAINFEAGSFAATYGGASFSPSFDGPAYSVAFTAFFTGIYVNYYSAGPDIVYGAFTPFFVSLKFVAYTHSHVEYYSPTFTSTSIFYVRTDTGPSYTRSYAGTRSFEGAGFSNTYVRSYTGTRTFSAGSFSRNYVATYAGQPAFVGEGSFSGTSYQATFTGTSFFTGFYAGPTYSGIRYPSYASAYTADYMTLYTTSYVAAYTNEYSAGYVGDTIQATSSTIETYTLYARSE
jgi:hypothetical protein